jgi:hypothetical protein
MLTSEKVDLIFPALIKAQSEMGNAKKTCANPFYKSKYADLSELIDVTKEVLFTNKMAIIQSPEGSGNTASVNCRIIHESGQWIEGTITLPLSKNDPQQAGSAITYARRYQLAALFNIAQEDDDGNGSSGKLYDTKKPDTILEKDAKAELEKQTVTLESFIASGIVAGENAVKAKNAITAKNLENIVKWNEWAKKQEAGK